MTKTFGWSAFSIIGYHIISTSIYNSIIGQHCLEKSNTITYEISFAIASHNDSYVVQLLFLSLYD